MSYKFLFSLNIIFVMRSGFKMLQGFFLPQIASPSFVIVVTFKVWCCGVTVMTKQTDLTLLSTGSDKSVYIMSHSQSGKSIWGLIWSDLFCIQRIWKKITKTHSSQLCRPLVWLDVITKYRKYQVQWGVLSTFRLPFKLYRQSCSEVLMNWC